MAIAIQKYRARYQWKRYSVITEDNLTYEIKKGSMDVTTPPYNGGQSCRGYGIALGSDKKYYFNAIQANAGSMKNMSQWLSTNIALVNSGYTASKVPYRYFIPYGAIVFTFTGDTDRYNKQYADCQTISTISVPGNPSIGDLIDIVASSDKYAYPDNGISGDYWYVRI